MAFKIPSGDFKYTDYDCDHKIWLPLRHKSRKVEFCEKLNLVLMPYKNRLDESKEFTIAICYGHNHDLET